MKAARTKWQNVLRDEFVELERHQMKDLIYCANELEFFFSKGIEELLKMLHWRMT